MGYKKIISLKKKQAVSRLFVLLLALCLPSTLVLAAGFRLPDVSIAGLGASNAVVADAKDVGALPYNPAVMSFHEDTNLDSGLVYLQFDLSVTPTGGTETDNIGQSNFLIPNMAISNQINSGWSWGIIVNSPFGLETEWPDNTFPFAAVVGTPTDDLFDLEISKLKMLNFNPNVAYKLSQYTSIAFGIDYYLVKNVTLNTQNVRISGDGDGLGWNIALLQSRGPLSLGISYRSAVDADIEGQFNSTLLATNSSATTTINFPAMLQLGVRYAFNPSWAVEFDFERTEWSSFDRIVIISGSPTSPTINTNNWEDANAYRLGVTYMVGANMHLRFGYAIDETPQTDSALFSARLPDADRQTFSIGIAHNFGSWTLDAGYMFIKIDERTVNSSIPFIGGEANGTNVYNGVYKNEAHLFGLGAQFKF